MKKYIIYLFSFFIVLLSVSCNKENIDTSTSIIINDTNSSNKQDNRFNEPQLTTLPQPTSIPLPTEKLQLTEIPQLTLIPETSDLQNNEIIKQEKIGNLSNFSLIKDYSKRIDTIKWGIVKLCPGIEKDKFDVRKLGIYLADEGDNILFKFPDFLGNKWIFYNIYSIEYKDVNDDGLNDIIIITTYIRGHGEDAAEEFNVSGIYFQTEEGFVNISELDEEINNENQNENIDIILEFIKDTDIEIMK